MRLASKKIVKNLLLSRGLRPSKRLGQHFLVDRRVLQDILTAAKLKNSDVVLEIGPGIGTLTQGLARQAKKVIAVEKDVKLAKFLQKSGGEFKNLKILYGDALKIDPKRYTLKARCYKVIANLPYYIVAPVVRKFLEAEHQPEMMVLMVQKEVAQRICAKPPRMSLLAVSVQFYAQPEIVRYVSKKSFWPMPKVDSAIIKIVPRQLAPSLSRGFRERFFKIVGAGFSQARKQLANSLTSGLKMDKELVLDWLNKNNIQPTRRAQTLTLSEWEKLTRASLRGLTTLVQSTEHITPYVFSARPSTK